MLLVSSCSCLYPIRWSQVLSWEWRCSWSSADRRCSNYIWVINNFIAYYGATYIRGFTVGTIGLVFNHIGVSIPHTHSWREMLRTLRRFSKTKAWDTTWWRHQMETFSALLTHCDRDSPVTGEFPSQRPVTRSFNFFICAWTNGWVNNRDAGD